MRSLRWISADAYARALNAPLGLRRGSYGTAVSSPFVFEQVRQELNAKLPPKLAARGGFQVYSTVDQRLQFAARRAIKDVLKSPGDPQAALVAINVHNGNVLALGTSDYFSAKNQFNLATVGHRSPGSTFKLFALVDALRRGADPTQGVLPLGLRLVPRGRPGLPAARRLVARQRRERLRGLLEPRDRDDPLGQRRLRPADARPRAEAGGGDGAPARASARSCRCIARWCSAPTTSRRSS